MMGNTEGLSHGASLWPPRTRSAPGSDRVAAEGPGSSADPGAGGPSAARDTAAAHDVTDVAATNAATAVELVVGPGQPELFGVFEFNNPGTLNLDPDSGADTASGRSLPETIRMLYSRVRYREVSEALEGAADVY